MPRLRYASAACAPDVTTCFELARSLRPAGRDRRAPAPDSSGPARRRVRCERLLQQLDGARRVLQPPFGVAEEREELRLVGASSSARLQLVAGAIDPAEIEVDVREIQPRRRQRLDRARAPAAAPRPLRPSGRARPGRDTRCRAACALRRATGSIARMAFSSRIDFVGAIGAGEQIGADALDARLQLGAGRASACAGAHRRPRRTPQPRAISRGDAAPRKGATRHSRDPM